MLWKLLPSVGSDLAGLVLGAALRAVLGRAIALRGAGHAVAAAWVVARTAARAAVVRRSDAACRSRGRLGRGQRLRRIDPLGLLAEEVPAKTLQLEADQLVELAVLVALVRHACELLL